MSKRWAHHQPVPTVVKAEYLWEFHRVAVQRWYASVNANGYVPVGKPRAQYKPPNFESMSLPDGTTVAVHGAWRVVGQARRPEPVKFDFQP